jgi:single-strand DNA-binding protein
MFIGRLGADVEMRYTPQGSAVSTFRIAVGRSYKSADGNAHDETEWVQVVAWQKLAELCNQYLRKASRVYIEGRMQTRSWEDATSGEKKYRTEVVAEDIIFLDTPQSREVDNSDDAPQTRQEAPQRPQPARPTSNAGNGYKATAAARVPRNAPPVTEDEDLPF